MHAANPSREPGGANYGLVERPKKMTQFVWKINVFPDGMPCLITPAIGAPIKLRYCDIAGQGTADITPINRYIPRRVRLLKRG